MPRGKKHGPEEVIPKLREAEVLISQGSTQELAAKQIGVTKQTLIRGRREYGGFRMDQAKRMKQLEKEKDEAVQGLVGIHVCAHFSGPNISLYLQNIIII